MGVRKIKSFGGQKQTQPIKDPKLLKEIIFLLKSKIDKAKTPVKRYQAYRNFMIFFIGVNTAFRAEDLLQLRRCDINGYVHIKENKTGKMQNYKLAKDVQNEIDAYCDEFKIGRYDYIFRGQKKQEDGKPYIYPLNRQQGHKIISSIGKEVGLEAHFGLHSLRKTFGYQYVKNGGNVNTLMRMYNHSSLDVTQIYISWNSDDAETTRSEFCISATGTIKKGKGK